MRLDQIDRQLRFLAFDFFYWFSRFEYVLKARGFLKSRVIGATAEPNWDIFVWKYRGAYSLTEAANALIAENPRRQIVVAGGLDFDDLRFSPNTADLDRVVAYAKAVRNNLFHGGKHGHDQWDDPEQMRRLLPLTITVLGELATLGEFHGDYSRDY